MPDGQEQAIEYVKSHSKDGEAIYVGNQRHDIILINDVSFYFLADRPSATKYSELHPGVATTRHVQDEIVAEIEAKKITWIVLVDIPASTEPNASSVSSNVHVLDDYIHAKFKQVTEFGRYTIWEKQ